MVSIKQELENTLRWLVKEQQTVTHFLWRNYYFYNIFGCHRKCIAKWCWRTFCDPSTRKRIKMAGQFSCKRLHIFSGEIMVSIYGVIQYLVVNANSYIKNILRFDSLLRSYTNIKRVNSCFSLCLHSS